MEDIRRVQANESSVLCSDLRSLPEWGDDSYWNIANAAYRTRNHVSGRQGFAGPGHNYEIAQIMDSVTAVVGFEVIGSRFRAPDAMNADQTSMAKGRCTAPCPTTSRTVCTVIGDFIPIGKDVCVRRRRLRGSPKTGVRPHRYCCMLASIRIPVSRPSWSWSRGRDAT